MLVGAIMDILPPLRSKTFCFSCLTLGVDSASEPLHGLRRKFFIAAMPVSVLDLTLLLWVSY
jgi:hypothetical protein